METREIDRKTMNGWVIVPALLLTGIAGGWFWYQSVLAKNVGGLVAIGVASLVWLVLCFGFFMLQPNTAAVMTLFGRFMGTQRESGFHWANPFFLKKKVSLRAHNLNGNKIKVNDLRGNPIEIATVVVWRVVDTAKASFDVEDFKDYVEVQTEAALRHLAMAYSYDTFDDETLSLRGSVDEVSRALQKEVQDRVARAGVLIEEARISHLAYAAEIASAMLQRQQAEAIVAARSRIVEGAVGMVEMALEKLRDHETIKLDDERKAAMVSNLMVVLCAHEPVRPVINAGTLYS